MVLGRSSGNDLIVAEPSVSRKHARLSVNASGDEIAVADLDSRNGTWLNGKRVSEALVHGGDSLAFGSIHFVVRHETGELQDHGSRPGSGAAAAQTHVFERPIPTPERALAELGSRAIADNAAERLTQLVQLAQHLGSFGELDELLEAIATRLKIAFGADLVAILLAETDGSLATRVARDDQNAVTHGAANPAANPATRAVPRLIASGVAERQVALLTNDAASDSLTAGESVIRQSVKSAMAAPLLGEDRVTLGVLYVDHQHTGSEFTENDLAFLIAFAGIASAAVERELSAQRLQQARRARENLERYFTPQLAERIAASATAAAPGGVRMPVVVLFSDIRKFTAIAESLAPTAMATQLNEYFAEMVDCIFRHNGALDKFIGDAIMAYWGAPEQSDNDALHAVSAAVDMQAALERLNRRWQSEGRPSLEVGIGIHCGDAFVGNIGSPRRLEYTLIGDTINMASRLCSLAGAGQILLSEAMVQSLGSAASCEICSDLHVFRHSSENSSVWLMNSLLRQPGQ